MADGDLQALGVLLRQTREAHALSLEEVEEQTRIRAKFLRALENGDISVLPSVAHAKGFLRNYAQFLRLDTNAIVAQFVELTGTGTVSVTTTTAPPSYASVPTSPTIPSFEQSPSTDSAPATEAARPPVHPARMPSLRVTSEQRVGPGLPVGVGRSESLDTGPKPERPPSALSRYFRSNVLMGGVLAIGMIAIVWWTVTQLSTISGSELIPTEQTSGVTSFGVTATVTEQTLTSQPTSDLQPTIEIPILGRVLLSITVTQRTWIRVTADEEVAFEGQAEPGNLLQYSGEQSIVVVASNGAALDVTHNGQSIGTLGEWGEPVLRIFTPTGQATPTATVTLTPTSTSVPTATPRLATPRFTSTPTRRP